jgi:hypothetical protein
MLLGLHLVLGQNIISLAVNLETVVNPRHTKIQVYNSLYNDIFFRIRVVHTKAN